MIDPVAEHIGGANAHYRAGAFFSQLAGWCSPATCSRVDPVASMTV